MPKAVTHPDVKKKKILHMLESWMVEEKERKQLRQLVKTMTPKKTDAVASAAGEPPAAPSTLSQYLNWFRGERAKRSTLLKALVPASRKEDAKKLHASMGRMGRPLGRREVRRAMKSNESMATYLASLSTGQLETYKEALENDVVAMPPKVKKTLLKLFTMLQKEQFAREQDWKKTVGPLATGVATALALQERINALEKIRSSLPSR